MSIERAKERIAGYYPGKQVRISRIADEQLKALADSHTRLLEAAKRFVEKGVWYNSSRDADMVDDDEFANLRAAIEGADARE